MRKLVVLVTALVAVLAASTVALAQSSQYDVTASTSPAKAGSKAKPVPASITFAVQAQGTGRPSTSKEFKVTFGGMKVNTKGFKTCTVSAINQAQGDSGCNKAAKVGEGFVKNLVGTAEDQTDVSISCNLAVTLYNAGGGRMAVFLKGSPTTQVQGGTCPIGVNQALDGKLANSSSGFSLSFTIPSNLMHPITGLNQGISEISTTISKKTIKSKGKTVGLVEAIGCKGGSRPVTLTLAAEAGGSSTSTGSAKC